MEIIEAYSWSFIHKEWGRLSRMPIPDKGFEESFRDYIYRKGEFDRVSDIRDAGFGLSYSAFSGVPHELDVICAKDKELFAYELKHYEVTNIAKEIVFTFLGKVIDFFLKNAEDLSNYKITMFLVTISRNVDDTVRKLCIAYGIKLIEPSLMTFGTMDYFARNLYQKMSVNDELKSQTEKLIEDITTLREKYDYSFSDIFRFKESKVEIDLSLCAGNTSEALNKIKKYYDLFERVRLTWKSKRN